MEQIKKPNIFRKRLNLKPYDYPQLTDYVDAIRHSYWIHTEFNYSSDIQDFKTKLNDTERSAIKNTMLAISQIEVAVKTFWGDIYHKIPKPEIGSVGATFAATDASLNIKRGFEKGFESKKEELKDKNGWN